MGFLLRSVVLLTIVCITQFQNAGAEWEKEMEEICGLREDHMLWGHCVEGGKKVDIKFYKEHVDAAKACKDKKDFRCYKACQLEKLGLLDPKSGQVCPQKFNEHLDRLFAGHDKATVEKIQDYAARCHVVDGKNVTISQTDCAHNDAVIKCCVQHFYEICRPNDKVPMVPTEMKKH